MSDILISGSIALRFNRLERIGDVVRGHTHNFDHTSLFGCGGARIECDLPDGRHVTSNVTGLAHRLIRADVKHEIINTGDTLRLARMQRAEEEIALLMKTATVEQVLALERLRGIIDAEKREAEVTVFVCAYNHRTVNGEIVEANTGWLPGYV